MKKLFYIVGIICLFSMTASIVYYLVYYIPYKDNREAETKSQQEREAIEAETESYCACLLSRAKEISNSKGDPVHCTNIHSDDTMSAVKCIHAGEIVASGQADRECKEKYPRTTKGPDFTDDILGCK